METFTITGEYIHLNQLLKLMRWCENGGEANAAIENGDVMVNGVVETRKRNKIIKGMKVQFDGQEVMVD
jgi:ribosome-associated protein